MTNRVPSSEFFIPEQGKGDQQGREECYCVVDPRGQGGAGGGLGPGLRFQPGVQELLVLLVDSCIYVGMCGSPGRRFIAFVSFSKASKSGKNLR